MTKFRVWAVAAVCGALTLWLAVGNSRADSSEDPEQDTWQQIQALHWVQGPNSVPALQNATFQLPGNYIFLDTNESDDFLRITENVPGVPEQIFAPNDFHWWASLDFSEDGYVKDEEKLDNDSILDSIRESTEQSNEERRRNGWGELHVAGWRTAPHYDTATKRLEWALDLKDEKGLISTNFQTRVLGRRGVANVTLVTDPEHVAADIAEFKSMLAGYRFNPGDTYTEFKQGDKVAAYGLAALIVGGGAAVAAKSGLLKFFGKFIWVGLLAAFAAVARLFKRKTG